jgi:hypothetical protein
MQRRTRLNPGNVLFVAGLALLGFMLAVPAATARRVARIEMRAEETARLLLAAALQLEPLDLTAPESAPKLAAGLRAACAAAGQPDSALPDLAAAPGRGRVLFETKHYLFLLGRVPNEAPVAEPAPLEVIAWPLDELSSGHAAFTFPADGAPAYSRNLVANYAGLRNAPEPGRTRPRAPPAPHRGQMTYRGFDDERWILLAGR